MTIIREQEPNAIKIASQNLKDGNIIAFATETVYALACDANNGAAIKKLYQLKERDSEKPLAVWTKNLAIAEEFLSFGNIEKKIASHFMPGAITMVLNAKKNSDLFISKLLNNGGKKLGLRIPQHGFSLKLLNEFDGVICATSANISGQPAAIECGQIIDYFKDKVNLIIDGGICEQKVASTVLQIDNDQIKILRIGAISEQQIRQAINE